MMFKLFKKSKLTFLLQKCHIHTPAGCTPYAKIKPALDYLPNEFQDNVVRIAQQHADLQNKILVFSAEKDTLNKSKLQLERELDAMKKQSNYYQYKLDEQNEKNQSLQRKQRSAEKHIANKVAIINKLTTENNNLIVDLKDNEILLEALIEENVNMLDGEDKLVKCKSTIALLQKRLRNKVSPEEYQKLQNEIQKFKNNEKWALNEIQAIKKKNDLLKVEYEPWKNWASCWKYCSNVLLWSMFFGTYLYLKQYQELEKSKAQMKSLQETSGSGTKIFKHGPKCACDFCEFCK
jgi:DNA repair exonuclease SbcCD ATPase subunit